MPHNHHHLAVDRSFGNIYRIIQTKRVGILSDGHSSTYNLVLNSRPIVGSLLIVLASQPANDGGSTLGSGLMAMACGANSFTKTVEIDPYVSLFMVISDGTTSTININNAYETVSGYPTYFLCAEVSGLQSSLYGSHSSGGGGGGGPIIPPATTPYVDTAQSYSPLVTASPYNISVTTNYINDIVVAGIYTSGAYITAGPARSTMIQNATNEAYPGLYLNILSEPTIGTHNYSYTDNSSFYAHTITTAVETQ